MDARTIIDSILGYDLNIQPDKADILPAKVMCNNDPEGIGRVRVYIPGVTAENLSRNQYPWAYPCQPVYNDKGLKVVPTEGDWVFIRNLDNKTIIYLGGWVSINDIVNPGVVKVYNGRVGIILYPGSIELNGSTNIRGNLRVSAM